MADAVQHPNLRAAVAAARRDARPLVKSERGGLKAQYRDKPPREDSPEHWWYFAPTEKVMEESQRLLRAHGLELEWLGSDLGPRGQVLSRWELSHTASGEHREYTYGAPPFVDAETPTHAVLGTTRHAERAVHLLVLQIPMVEQPREGDVVEGGIIVSRRTEAPKPAAPRQQGTEWESEPLPEFWEPPVPGDSDGTGGGLVDPGPLGGEDPEPADHDPAELAAEADAAARGHVEPTPEVDAGALLDAVRRWGKATGCVGKSMLAEALKQAHDGAAGADWARAPIIGSPEALARRGRLVALLREGGHLS